tara:strand:+ start:199 stop:513 length:315 start_codon:yes stop_codon:yes gene_type:complete
MKLPKSIHIAGVPVKILQEDLSDEDNLSKGYYGYYSHKRKVIAVDKNLDPSDVRGTIRHEMLHASLALSGLDHLEHFEEEALVRCVDEIFFPAWERFLKRFNTD